MGLSSSKTKTTTKQDATVAPSTYSQPYIDSAASTFKPGYDLAVANNASLLPKVNASIDHFSNTVSGPLTGNPYTDAIVKQTNANVTNGVDSRFASAGRYGSGMYAGTLAKALAENETNLRYQDYTAQQGRQDDAARAVLSGAGISAALPQAAGSTYSDQVRALLGGYNNSTGTTVGTVQQSGGLLNSLLQAGALVGASYVGKH